MRAAIWRVFCGGMLTVLLILRPGISSAGTIYTLTGDPYNGCSGSYAAGGGCGPYFLSGWFELADGFNVDSLSPGNEGALLSPVYNVGNVDPYVVAFSFSDGNGLTISSAQSNASHVFNIDTDASGQIVWWYIDLCLANCSTGFGGSTEESYWFPSYPQTYEQSSTPTGMGSCFAYGVASPVGNCGGGWAAPVTSSSGVSAVPEPSTLVLLGVGLVALVAQRKSWPSSARGGSSRRRAGGSSQLR